MAYKTYHAKGLKNQKTVLKELLAKSLVAFICVGLISGLIFGIYLTDVKKSSQLVFVEGPSISIVTEKSDFKLGEPMNIWVVNSGTVPLFYTDTSFNLRITSLFGVLLYSPPASDTEIILEPGENATFSWNHVKNNGDTAFDGIYKISATGQSGLGQVEDSITVTIWK